MRGERVIAMPHPSYRLHPFTPSCITRASAANKHASTKTLGVVADRVGIVVVAARLGDCGGQGCGALPWKKRPVRPSISGIERATGGIGDHRATGGHGSSGVMPKSSSPGKTKARQLANSSRLRSSLKHGPETPDIRPCDGFERGVVAPCAKNFKRQTQCWKRTHRQIDLLIWDQPPAGQIEILGLLRAIGRQIDGRRDDRGLAAIVAPDAPGHRARVGHE